MLIRKLRSFRPRLLASGRIGPQTFWPIPTEAGSFKDVYCSPLAVLADFLLAEDDAERYASGASLNTDDRLPLEFSAPLSLYRDTAQMSYRIMKGYQTRQIPAMAHDGLSQLEQPEIRFDRGMGYLAKCLPLEAIEQFEKVLMADPGYLQARVELGQSAAPG